MKKTSLFVSSILVLFISVNLISGCKTENNKNDYLRKVFNNLEQIKSDNYISAESYSAFFDTVIFKSRNLYIKEFNNPVDTFIGASFAAFEPVDTSKMQWLYDGKTMTNLNWDEKTIKINYFQNDSSPVRQTWIPFINRTKSIIKYALETHDSISVDLKDFGDSIQFILLIHNKAVEFFGKPYYMESPLYIPSSRYDVWINKSDDLPYRYTRSTPYQTSWVTCKNIIVNQNKIGDFIASKHVPPDFKTQKTAKDDLVGKVATNWILKNVNNDTISLQDMHSKVVMIQFSGIGCAPCHMSIPFLKKLALEYSEKDFDFVSIESWSNNIDGIKRYQINNDLNYKFLISTEEVKSSYQIGAVPAFFILDKNRVIRRIIEGYGKETTDKEIRDAINELL